MLNDYKKNSEWWNRETELVYQNLMKEVDLQEDQIDYSTKSQYEDPKLTQMKKAMELKKNSWNQRNTGQFYVGGSNKVSRVQRNPSPLKMKYDLQGQGDIFNSNHPPKA